ncbi:hypothetical protein CC614_09545 [Salmonella enterica subsp. enterica serovar Newport]|nr:hypothetical protein [Salmonella enterica subsp. enterica serovar Newport]
MTVYLKMINGHSNEIADANRPFNLYPVPDGACIEFNRDPTGNPFINVVMSDKTKRSFYPTGNTYVVEDKTTVSKFEFEEKFSAEDRKETLDFLQSLDSYQNLPADIKCLKIEDMLLALKHTPLKCSEKTPRVFNIRLLKYCTQPVRVKESQTPLLEKLFSDCGYPHVGFIYPEPEKSSTERTVTHIVVKLPSAENILSGW